MNIKPFIPFSVLIAFLAGIGLTVFLNPAGSRPPQSAIATAPIAMPEPTRVPFYELPTPEPALPTPALASPTPTPAFAPDPELLAFANAILAQRPWTQVNGQWVTGLPVPEQTSFTFLYEPHIEKQEIDGRPAWIVTFKP